MMNRIQVLQAIIDRKSACRYLEIGVRDGVCFFRIRRTRLKLAVDPNFVFSKKTYYLQSLRNPSNMFSSQYYAMTSDEFFLKHAQSLENKKLDVVFIDGLHTYEQSHRDAENALKYLKKDGVIVLHDCNPNSEIAAEPAISAEQISKKYKGKPDWDGFWNGDVWKTIIRMRTRPDLNIRVLNCDFGLGIIRQGKAKPLEIKPEEINLLSYADLARERKELLNLTDPGEFNTLLKDMDS